MVESAKGQKESFVLAAFAIGAQLSCERQPVHTFGVKSRKQTVELIKHEVAAHTYERGSQTRLVRQLGRPQMAIFRI